MKLSMKLVLRGVFGMNRPFIRKIGKEMISKITKDFRHWKRLQETNT